ncbi:MAG: RNA 3'-terminal phosphate cyclase [Myxococcota bacterium]
MSQTAIVVDGSEGEGGGQILRSSLALSLVTGTPLQIREIRARRRKPGLMRQHLTAVRAAAEVGGATVEGDELRSLRLSFSPGTVKAGEYRFSVGTAGSITLVLQTVLWPLLLAEGRSTVVLEGGTHNPMAPPFDHVQRSLLPLLRRMGASVELELRRPGFYPAGGGCMIATIDGGRSLSRLDCLERGSLQGVVARAQVSELPVSIARRELAVVHERLGWTQRELHVERIDARGPGNVLMLEVTHEGGTTVVSSFGAKGVTAEQVAENGIAELDRFLAAQVPIDSHLADQLLIPMALTGGGSMRSTKPTMHTRSNAALIERWLPVSIGFTEQACGAWQIEVAPRGATK